MKKHLLASILFVFACASQAADFSTSVGDINKLYEGRTQGDGDSQNWSKFYNNSLSISRDSGRTFIVATAGPFAGDGKYRLNGVIRYSLGSSWSNYSGDCNVSGWTSGAKVTGQGAKVAIPAGGSGYVQFYRQAPLIAGAFTAITFPDIYDNSSCMPVVEIVSSNLPDKCSVSIHNDANGHKYLKIDASRVVLPIGEESVVGTVELSGYNGYNYYADGLDAEGYKKVKLIKATATLEITISKLVLNIYVTTDPAGAVAREGGITAVEVSTAIGGTGGQIKVGQSASIPVGSVSGEVYMSAIADGSVYGFQKWKGNKWSSNAPEELAKFSDIAGSELATVGELIAVFDILADEKTALFTSSYFGRGVASPKSKYVPIGDSVKFTCIEKGGTLTSVVYKVGKESKSMEVEPKNGSYYDMFVFTIPIEADTTATATFDERKISDDDFDDAKDTISGGGNPATLPLPSLLGDSQLSDLYKLLLDRSKLEPGTWDYAVKLYEDEIKDRTDDLDDLINNDETPDDIKDDLTDYKNTFPKIGTGTNTTPTTTTTKPTGTTISTTIERTTATEDPEPSDPAMGAAAAGGLLFLNQDKRLYKPHWTTERPETPLDRMMKKK